MTCIWLIILILIEYKRFHRTKFIMNLLDVPKTRDRRYRLQLILSNLLFIWRHKCHHFNIKEKKKLVLLESLFVKCKMRKVNKKSYKNLFQNQSNLLKVRRRKKTIWNVCCLGNRPLCTHENEWIHSFKWKLKWTNKFSYIVFYRI